MSRPRADHPSVESDRQTNLHHVVHSLQRRLGSFDAVGLLLVRRSQRLPEVDLSAGRDRRQFDLHLFGAPGPTGMVGSGSRCIHAALFMARRLRARGSILRGSVDHVVFMLLALSAKDFLQTLVADCRIDFVSMTLPLPLVAAKYRRDNPQDEGSYNSQATELSAWGNRSVRTRTSPICLARRDRY